MAIELIEINADIDGKGMSILRKQYEIINGVKYYATQERRAFRTHKIIEVNNETQEVVNATYSADIDDWTGVTNFLTTVYNQ
jgi:hypothetical protein